MIRVLYDTQNKVALPLDANGFGPYYLFEVFSEMQNEVVKTFVSPDTSTAVERAARFNEFTFTEAGTGAEDLYGGRVKLNDGTYLLRVYEQNASGSLTPQGDIVYREILKVYGNPTQEYLNYSGPPSDFEEYKFLQ